jgi:hypothetical protein
VCLDVIGCFTEQFGVVVEVAEAMVAGRTDDTSDFPVVVGVVNREVVFIW